MSESSRSHRLPAASTSSLVPASDWLFVGLVGVLVVVDGALGVTYAGAVSGRPFALPVPPALLWMVLGGLGLCGGLVGSVAAGLRSPAYAWVAILALPAAAAYWVTGLVLPWDQWAYWIANVLLDVFLLIPVAGELLAGLLFGGTTLSAATLEHAFRLHYGILAVAGIAAAGVLGWRGWRRYAGTGGG